MKSNNVTLTLLVILAVLAVAILKWRQEPPQREAFDRRPRELVFTKGALCAMECRGISERDVEEVMAKGIIHFNKSNKAARPCPTFALQGRTRDSVYLSVVFAQCSDITRVVNCYNLEQDMDCPCSEEEPKPTK